MMNDMNLHARGQSLKDLVGAMEEDDAKSIPTLMIKITSGPGGIHVEKTGGDGEVANDMMEGNPEHEAGETPEQEKEEMAAGDTESPASHMEVIEPNDESNDISGGPESAFEMLIAKKKKIKDGNSY